MRIDRKCRLCSSVSINEVFELRPTPPGDLFLPEENVRLSTEKYPLVMALCENCGYLHLPYVLDPNISYSNYVYETKVTVGLTQQYNDHAEEIISFGQIPNSSFVVDLGSNDGTTLRAFKDRGMKVLGVEPNKQISTSANRCNLPTINDYFSTGISQQIINEYGKASIVTANYMYANIDHIMQFTGNVKNLMDEQGLFVIQTGYHPQQMKVMMFDYIYHEHFSYFSVTVMKTLLERCGMELIKVGKHPAKGGSIKVIAQHANGKRKADKSVQQFVQEEESERIHCPETYTRFASDIQERKKDIIELITQLKSAGCSIIGYGASHSTTTLLHHFELGEYLDYIVDDNPIKHGLFSPGYHLPVYPSDKLYTDKPEYVLVLGWQHKDSILNRNIEYMAGGGRFIVPLPVLKVIDEPL